MKPLSCLQVNLQHKRAATSNLVQMMSENQIDLAFVQEPYIIHNNVAGIRKSLTTYVSVNGRKRSALLVNNKEIDVVIITQFSDEDCIVAEISYGNTKFYGISSYFDITEDIEINIRKMEHILNYSKGQGLLIAAASNARSKTWYDTITNKRGKVLEDFLNIYNVYTYIVNHRTEPTFETTRGSSYVDLTIVNSQLLRRVTDWTCGTQESCSDHKLLTFNLRKVRQDRPFDNTDYVGLRYIIKNKDYGRFEAILSSNMMTTFNCENNKEGLEKIDEELCNKIYFYEDVDELVDTAFSCITAACNKVFKVSRGAKHSIKKKNCRFVVDRRINSVEKED